jgi:hypothetical protein
VSTPKGRNDDLAQIAAILATGYLRLLAQRANSRTQAQLQSPDSVYSPCYATPPET